MYDNFRALQQTAGTGTTVDFIGYFLNCTPETIPSLSLGVKFQPENEGDITYVSVQDPISDWKFYKALGGFTVTLPTDLADGNYTVTPAFRVEGRDWQEIPSFLDVNGKLYADVGGNSVTFTTPAQPIIAVSDITAPAEILMDKASPFSYVITNPGDKEYVGMAYPYLIDSDDDIIAEADPLPIDLLAKESKTFTDIPTSFTAYEISSNKFADYKAGDYLLEFRDDTGNTISDRVAVTVKDAPTEDTEIQVTEFKLLSENPVYELNAVEFSLTLECTSGYFGDYLNFIIFPDSGSGQVYNAYSTQSPYFYLSKGESATKTFTVNLSSLDYGKYFAQMFKGNISAGNRVDFELSKKIGTGIDELNANNEKELIYDLYGVRHTRPLSPGLYIINGKKALVK